MMGHQSRQMAMLFVDIESLIPETHLLRRSSGWYPLISSMIFWHHIAYLTASRKSYPPRAWQSNGRFH